MNSVNDCTLIGRLGKDPEVSIITEKMSVAKMTIATGRQWFDKKTEKWESKTTWHRVVVWNPNKSLIGATKGQMVYFKGRYEANEWTDNDGKKHYDLELIANETWVLPKGEGKPFQTEEQKAEKKTNTYNQPATELPADWPTDIPPDDSGFDDLPF